MANWIQQLQTDVTRLWRRMPQFPDSEIGGVAQYPPVPPVTTGGGGGGGGGGSGNVWVGWLDDPIAEGDSGVAVIYTGFGAAAAPDTIVSVYNRIGDVEPGWCFITGDSATGDYEVLRGTC